MIEILIVIVFRLIVIHYYKIQLKIAKNSIILFVDVIVFKI